LNATVCGLAKIFHSLVGRRWFVIGGTLIVVVGDIVAATAHSIGAVIAGTTLAGIGQGGVTVTV
jgi:hypothetical protein